MIDESEIQVPSEPMTEAEMLQGLQPAIDRELIDIARLLEILEPYGPHHKRRILEYISSRIGIA